LKRRREEILQQSFCKKLQRILLLFAHIGIGGVGINRHLNRFIFNELLETRFNFSTNHHVLRGKLRIEFFVNASVIRFHSDIKGRAQS